jgi:tetratricopeptide (TPR) repeat protein
LDAEFQEAVKMSEGEKNRRELLEDMVRNQPNDTFARYGLAMELAKSEPDAAWKQFSQLLEQHPEYAPTYYQAAAFLSKQSRLEEARIVLQNGLGVTSRQGNRHAHGELQALLDDLDDRL